MKTVLLIVSGSIAAYKACDVARGLMKANCKVVPVLTPGAEEFITPLLMQALTGQEVHQDLFDGDCTDKMDHIHLVRNADLVLVCPATANTIAKAAEGIADNLASTLLLSAECPVMFAPAMNKAMFSNRATQDNISRLAKRGVAFIQPETGKLACGEFGEGRLAEVDQIVERALETLNISSQRLRGVKVVLTAGPTYEPIDPVRFIGNRSSGKQGYAIAEALTDLGAMVTLISGPCNLPAPDNVNFIQVETAEQMKDAVADSLFACDVFIGCAAVSDWHIKNPSKDKLKKKDGSAPRLEFEQNPDILEFVGSHTDRPKLVIGFCAETSDLEKNVKEKRERKKANWILGNDISKHPFGGDNNEILFCTKSGDKLWKSQTKLSIARKLATQIACFLKR